MTRTKPMEHMDHARSRDDEWSEIAAKKERKKRQNRLNQRARRSRKEQETTETKDSKRFRVERWRIDERIQGLSLEEAESSSTSIEENTQSSDETTIMPTDLGPTLSGFTNDDLMTLQERQRLQYSSHRVLTSRTSLVRTAGHPASSFECASVIFPLSSDHLLHLIHHNVLRAVTTNKCILRTCTQLSRLLTQEIVVPSTTDLCDGLTVIRPTRSTGLPPSLIPTLAQTSLPHSSWINMLPFPGMRDNVIRVGDTLNVVALCYDLFGSFMANYEAQSECSVQSVFPGFGGENHTTTTSSSTEIRSLSNTERNGLIVWGEPWKIEDWEVTPGFYRKWGWLLVGCEELLVATDKWRAKRGEEPLATAVMMEQ